MDIVKIMESVLVSRRFCSILSLLMYIMSTSSIYIGEKPEEEGQNNDGLNPGSIVGIILACLVTALLTLILIIVSVIAVYRERKKRMGNAELKSKPKRYETNTCKSRSSNSYNYI